MNTCKITGMLALLLCLSASLFAGKREHFLKLGDDAPALSIMKWVRGTPVNTFEKGKYYVVEFTGAGCPPCRKAMPHLSKLSRKYKGQLDIISVFDGLSDTGEPGYMDIFNELLRENGHNMDYTIAIDMPRNITTKAWGLQGVPEVFIVNDQGKIAWYGYPDEMDEPVALAAAGKLDIAAASALMAETSRIFSFFAEVDELEKSGRYRLALQRLDSAIAEFTAQKSPTRKWAYGLKIHVLAGNDDPQLSHWMKWMLSDANREDMADFDFEHTVGSVMYKSKRKDFDIILALIDRCVQTAEYQTQAGHLMDYKGRAYAFKSHTRLSVKEARQDLDSAILHYDNAINILRRSGNGLKKIGDMYRDRSKLQYVKAAAVRDRDSSRAIFQRLLNDYVATGDTLRYKWPIRGLQNDIRSLDSRNERISSLISDPLMYKLSDCKCLTYHQAFEPANMKIVCGWINCPAEKPDTYHCILLAEHKTVKEASNYAICEKNRVPFFIQVDEAKQNISLYQLTNGKYKLLHSGKTISERITLPECGDILLDLYNLWF